jgi:hypothetical protein
MLAAAVQALAVQQEQERQQAREQLQLLLVQQAVRARGAKHVQYCCVAATCITFSLVTLVKAKTLTLQVLMKLLICQQSKALSQTCC